MALTAGTRLGRYEILAPNGAGGPLKWKIGVGTQQ
jgi:hypothetical protein